MKYILVHGLGQNETSWNEVESKLSNKNISTEKPNLYVMMKTKVANYDALYRQFEKC